MRKRLLPIIVLLSANFSFADDQDIESFPYSPEVMACRKALSGFDFSKLPEQKTKFGFKEKLKNYCFEDQQFHLTPNLEKCLINSLVASEHGVQALLYLERTEFEHCESPEFVKLQEEGKKIQFLMDFNLGSKTYTSNQRLGGISGGIYHKKSKTFELVSDRMFSYGGAYSISFSFENVQDRFKFKSSVKGINTYPEIQNLEAVTSNGRDLVFGIESFDTTNENLNGLFVVSPEKDLTAIELPLTYQNVEVSRTPKAGIEDDPAVFNLGPQENLGIEGASFSPSGRFLYAVSEEPLSSDVDARFDGKPVARILKYLARKDGSYKLIGQFLYPIENFGEDNNYGISEILAISDHELLIMERKWDHPNKHTNVRIYKVDLEDAVNIVRDARKLDRQGQDAISNAGKDKNISAENYSLYDVRSVNKSKEPLYNFDDVLPALAPGYRDMDNLETMVLGPKLANGRHLLVVAGDSNFRRPPQRTQILLMSIDLK